ncbi:MAG: FAD-dependent oxidoreductase [Cellvibrionaceae bacterium]|nr:FAD-dependent oxidoreductase [Cellvibrionaceae bacterium]
MHKQAVHLIFGGGIAGLWLLNRLNQQGLYTLLVDTADLGGGQTLSSQGIIHGGVKYTLNGVLSGSANAIAAMPARWLACLQGRGEIDLRQTQVLCDHQLMWSNQRLSGQLASFFSSKALRSKIQKLPPKDYPEAFRNPAFQGQVYQLKEPVVDVHSLVKNLAAPWKDQIIHTTDYQLLQKSDGALSHIILNQQLKIPVQHCILAAGEGNQTLVKQLGLGSPKMQRRPLQMVLVKGRKLAPLYAHCVGASTKPLLTITTHRHKDGDKVWYIGGNIAEQGAAEQDAALIQHTQASVKQWLPWIDFADSRWATHRINRAEPLQSGLLRPDTAFVETHNNIMVTWPTKLALAPVLADKVLAQLKKTTDTTCTVGFDTHGLSQLHNKRAISCPPLWDRVF